MAAGRVTACPEAGVDRGGGEQLDPAAVLHRGATQSFSQRFEKRLIPRDFCAVAEGWRREWEKFPDFLPLAISEA
jgi:hypothetical protein